jgi:hypothetical protein
MTLAAAFPASFSVTAALLAHLPAHYQIGGYIAPRDLRHIPAGALRDAAKAVEAEVGRSGSVCVYLFADLSWGVGYCSHLGVGDTEFAAVPLPLDGLTRAVAHINAVRLGAAYRGFTLSVAEIVSAIGTDEHIKHATYSIGGSSYDLAIATTKQLEDAARARFIFAARA